MIFLVIFQSFLSIKIIRIVVLVTVLSGILGCGRHPSNTLEKEYSETRFLLGTMIKIETCYLPSQQYFVKPVYQKIWKHLENIHHNLNAFDPQSDVGTINQNPQKPVIIHSLTYQILSEAIRFCDLTSGAFDMTIGPLMLLWREAEKQNRLPSKEEIEKAKQSMGSHYIQLLDHQRVQIRHPETKIDLGAIAEGFAADETARIFRRAGFQNFLIDAGGDFYAGGHNCQSKPWRIGIQHPRQKDNLIDKIKLQNAAVATSGGYEQGFIINKHHWSHILNPQTGYPQEGIISATVVAPQAIAADALATALCVLSPEKGIALINSLGKGYGCLLVVDNKGGDLEIYQSDRYKLMR